MFPAQHDRDYYRSLSTENLLAVADDYGDAIPSELAIALREALQDEHDYNQKDQDA